MAGPIRSLISGAVATIATLATLVAPLSGAAPAHAQGTSDATTLVGTSLATTASAAGLKPSLHGLVVTEPGKLQTVPYADYGSMKLRWNAIETRRGVFNFSAVDSVLDAHPGVKFRLRFMAGIHAPQWVKNDAGGSVLITPDSTNGNTGYAARFWTDSYHADYRALMSAVAKRYEADPQVVEIANSECTTIYAEPFILGADDESVDRLWRAGYTKDGHARCLRRSTSQLMRLFPTTRVSLAGHSQWQYVVAGSHDGARKASWTAERALLNDLVAAHGRHLVLEDHGLGPDDAVCRTPGQPRTTAGSWYCYMAGLHGTPVAHGWQFTLNGGSMADAANAGVAMGACFLEFAAFDALTVTKRRAVHDALLANCQ